jgi:adhesin transport system outer membrane protein
MVMGNNGDPRVNTSINLKEFKLNRQLKTAMICAVGLTSMVCASSVAAQSLKSSVQTALNSYPEIEEARYLRKAIESDLDLAKSQYYPTVDLEIAYGHEYSQNGSTRAAGNNDWVDIDRKETGLKMTEIIFDGFEREGKIEEQEAKLRGSLEHIGDRSEVLAADVTFAYVDVVRHKEILALAKDSVQVHQKILDDVKERVDNGQLGVGDLHQARSRLSNANARVTEVETDLDNAKISFNRVVGQMPRNLARPMFNDARLPSSVNAAVATAMKNNPNIKKYQADLDAAKAKIRWSKAGKYPTFLFELGGTYNDNIDGTLGIDKDFAAMLRMKWNLYRGGADNAREKAAAARHSQSMSQVANAMRNIEQEVRRAWTSMKKKDDEVRSRAAQVQSNKDVAETYKEQFKVGKRDLLDLLDAENELLSSKTKHLSAQYSALYARYLVMATTGNLRQMLGVTTPVEITQNNQN